MVKYVMGQPSEVRWSCPFLMRAEHCSYKVIHIKQNKIRKSCTLWQAYGFLCIWNQVFLFDKQFLFDMIQNLTTVCL